MDSPSQQVSLDDLLGALSHARRRKLLNSLSADPPPQRIIDSGITVDDDMVMHHNHLPKLANCGLINWDREANRVTKGPNFEAAEEILEFLADNEGILPPEEIEL